MDRFPSSSLVLSIEGKVPGMCCEWTGRGVPPREVRGTGTGIRAHLRKHRCYRQHINHERMTRDECGEAGVLPEDPGCPESMLLFAF